MRTVVITVAMVGLLGLAGCGDDDGDGAAAGGLERFCELARSLDAAGGEEIEIDFDSPTPDPEQVMAEFSAFLEDHEAEIDEYRELAPQEIEADVETLLETLREVARTGDLSAFDESEEAEHRVTELEREECGLNAE